MKLLLTSAGLTNDIIANALEELASKTLTELRVLLVPTVANTSVEDKSWLTQNIFEFTSRNPKTFNLIDIAGLPPELWQKHFDDADVICVGGGDESYLARIFTQQEVKKYLQESLKDRVYMGISAGSMVAGIFLPDGMNLELYGEECESGTGTGMELFDFTFVPHMNSPYFPGVTTSILECKSGVFNSKVIATDDFTAVKIDGGVISFVGNGDRLELTK